MNFEDILKEWENQKKQDKEKKTISNYINEYLPDESTILEKEEEKKVNPAEERNARLKMKPQKELDLHGLCVKEAIRRTGIFIKECRQLGIKKILIIHGKGKHSRNPPILRKKIEEYIQKHPLTGEYGYAHKNMGGSGAMWVILR